jgi:hypothetical protein
MSIATSGVFDSRGKRLRFLYTTAQNALSSRSPLLARKATKVD